MIAAFSNIFLIQRKCFLFSSFVKCLFRCLMGLKFSIIKSNTHLVSRHRPFLQNKALDWLLGRILNSKLDPNPDKDNIL